MKFTANRVSHLSRSVDLCDRVKSNVLSLCLTRSISVSLSPSYAAKPRRLSLSSSAAPFPSFPPLSFKKVSTTIAFTRYLLIVTALLRRHKSAVYDRLSGHDGVRGIPPAGLLPPMRLYDVVLHTYIYIYIYTQEGSLLIRRREKQYNDRGRRTYNPWQKSLKHEFQNDRDVYNDIFHAIFLSLHQNIYLIDRVYLHISILQFERKIFRLGLIFCH